MTARQRRVRRSDDDGSISLFFAIVTVAALMMAGLVVDGGAALAARERAADLATQAARAGAAALTPTSLRAGGPLTADPAAATRAANAVLDDAGAAGQVHVDGATVTVTVRVPRHTVILSAVGLTDISQTASATATAITGTATTPDGG